MKLLLWVAIFLNTVLIPGQPQSIGAADAQSITIKSYVHSMSPEALSASDARVMIDIENRTHTPVTITGCSVFLEPRAASESKALRAMQARYWAPLDVANAGAAEPQLVTGDRWNYQDQRIIVPATSTLELEIDLSRLKWGAEKSSTLPNAGLFAVVPDGNYSIHAEIMYSDESHLHAKTVTPQISVLVKR